MKVGYFCSGGYTEAGGIAAFLAKVNPSVRWERCFPAYAKPAPKLNRPVARPKYEEDAGISGADLVHRTRDRLRRYYRAPGSFDAVLFIDDADCRFEGTAQTGFEDWTQLLSQSFRADTGRQDLPVHVLLAAPEVEGWFVADWERSFAQLYPTLSHQLRERVRVALGPVLDNPESFGGPEKPGGGCSTKLSERLAELLKASASPDRPQEYSKRREGPLMLAQIEPEHVARRCIIYFARPYRKLAALR